MCQNQNKETKEENTKKEKICTLACPQNFAQKRKYFKIKKNNDDQTDWAVDEKKRPEKNHSGKTSKNKRKKRKLLEFPDQGAIKKQQKKPKTSLKICFKNQK